MPSSVRLGDLVAPLLFVTALASQQPATPPPWLGGYAHDVAGVTIDYDSALPSVHSALMVRSRREEPRIAWQTQPLPGDLQGDATFVWLFGIDADAEQHTFTLRCSGSEVRFHNPAQSQLQTWEVEGGGLRLRFRPTRIDRHGDLFGFATLRVPRELLAPGRPLQLEVTGDDSGSRIWYMTFRSSPEAGARLLPVPAVLRGDPELQPVWLDIVHLGEAQQALIECDFAPPLRAHLDFGHNRVELLCPPADAPGVERQVVVHVGDVAWTAHCAQPEVPHWTVHLVQHTHTDIGYTRPQTEILPEHLRYIDYALDYCDQTDALPEDARFRWTCEAAWPVREWLLSRPPAQVARLRRRVAEGRIELTAMCANLSELLDARSCAASLLPLQTLRDHDLPVVLAMQNDVNGIAWTFADLLPELGVRYLSMGENGHRALVPFALPTAFWWESPTGKRLLAFRADHYMTGNLWSLHHGREDSVAPAMFRYLEDLQLRGYPYRRVAVQYSGTILDNSPPATRACEFIRDWNERYEWPHLRSSVASEFLRWVESEHGDELPVQRQAWPDWWSDGIGSAPREAAAARRTQDQLRAVEATLAAALLLGEPLPATVLARLQRIREQLVMYGEHTYGAAESISDPDCTNSQVQWAEKAAYVWDAVKDAAMLQEQALGLLQPHLQRADAPVLAVFNPRGAPLTGMVRVYIDHALLPRGRNFRLLDERGEAAMHQELEGNPDGTWHGVGVHDVPPFGAACYSLRVDGEAAAGHAEPAVAGDLTLASGYYTLVLDGRTGGIRSLLDQSLQQELVDAQSPWHLGQLVQETLGDRAQLERLRLDRFDRSTLPATRVERGVAGPLFTSAIVHGNGGMCPDGFTMEVRLFQQQPRVELHYRVQKRRSTAPEGLYAAFPVGLGGAQLVYDLGNALVAPERDLLPGTSADWQAAQGAVAVRNGRATVLLGSRDNLLWQFGGLQLGRFRPVAVVERPHAFAWLLNNYWVTNFLASEDGELHWSFALTSGPPVPGAAEQFALDEATPALCRVLPAWQGECCDLPPPLRLDAPGALVQSLRPDRAGTAVVLQLQATDAVEVKIAAPTGARLQRVDALDQPIGKPAATLPLGAGERAFARLLR